MVNTPAKNRHVSILESAFSSVRHHKATSMAVEYKELQAKVILCDIIILSRRNHSLAKRHVI